MATLGAAQDKLGLLSLIDTILEVPIAAVLENISIDQETKSVLLGGASRLRPLYQLMLAQESGEWEVAAGLANQLPLRTTRFQVSTGRQWSGRARSQVER